MQCIYFHPIKQYHSENYGTRRSKVHINDLTQYVQFPRRILRKKLVTSAYLSDEALSLNSDVHHQTELISTSSRNYSLIVPYCTKCVVPHIIYAYAGTPIILISWKLNSSACTLTSFHPLRSKILANSGTVRSWPFSPTNIYNHSDQQGSVEH